MTDRERLKKYIELRKHYLELDNVFSESINDFIEDIFDISIVDMYIDKYLIDDYICDGCVYILHETFGYIKVTDIEDFLNIIETLSIQDKEEAKLATEG